MHILLVILLFAVGIILIVKGGDYFVDAASWMAEVSGIPKLIVGATVVSFATTLPELLVSAFAAAQGKVDMSIGNAVGSVTANLGLIMAIALICMPTVIKRRDYMLKSCLMLGAALFLVIFGAGGELALIPSILLLVIFIVAMAENIHEARLGMREEEREEEAGLKQNPPRKRLPSMLSNLSSVRSASFWVHSFLLITAASLPALSVCPSGLSALRSLQSAHRSRSW